MNVSSLYKLASLLDIEGKYLEADVVYDSMIRLAAPDGRGRTQGRPRPRDINPRLTPEQVRAKYPQTPVTPQVTAPTYNPDEVPAPRTPVETPNARPVRKNPGNPFQPRGEGGRFIKAPSSSYNPDPFGNYGIRDTLSYTDPGPVKQPANTQFRRVSPGQTQLHPMGLQDPSLPRPPGYAQPTQTPRVAPKSIGQMNNEVRMRVFQNPKLNPQLAAQLELERSLGRFNPKTGDLAESALETLGRAYEKAGPTVVQQGGRGGQVGAKAAQFVAKAKNSPAAGSVVNALEKISGTLKFIKPITKLLPFIGFALAIPDFVRLCKRINQDGWETIWNDPYDRAKAIGVIANTVAAAVSIAPGPLTPVAAALSAIGMGSDLGADVARDAGDAVEGGEFKLFGKTIKQKSQQRKDQEAFEAGINAKTIDPQVQAALSQSKNMLMSGAKISDILSDPRMKQTFPWLGTSDAKDAQFRVQITALRKSLRAGNAQEPQMQQPSGNQQSTGNMLNKQPYGTQNAYSIQDEEQQGQVRQQPQMPQLNSYNDLLYKAYVDTTQNRNVTLDNMKNYRDQIIAKIQSLSKYYPNINAQQAITALDNRIRKYSGQTQPA